VNNSIREHAGRLSPQSEENNKLRIESSALFQGEREIVIIHQKEEYNLRITRNGKLILTK
jgi:hemin uptake protein HemP